MQGSCKHTAFKFYKIRLFIEKLREYDKEAQMRHAKLSVYQGHLKEHASVPWAITWSRKIIPAYLYRFQVYAQDICWPFHGSGG
jgi:hypothetical protein